MDRGVLAAASELFEARHFPGVVAVCNDALEAEADCLPLLMLRARAHTALRRDLDAQADLRDVLRLEPSCALAYRLLGELAARRDENESALHFFREALRLEPGDREARDWLVVVETLLRPAAVEQLPAPAAVQFSLRPRGVPAAPERLARGTQAPDPEELPTRAVSARGSGPMAKHAATPDDILDEQPTRPAPRKSQPVIDEQVTHLRTRHFEAAVTHAAHGSQRAIGVRGTGGQVELATARGAEAPTLRGADRHADIPLSRTRPARPVQLAAPSDDDPTGAIRAVPGTRAPDEPTERDVVALAPSPTATQRTVPRAARSDLPGFGEFLVARGVLTRERLRAAEAYQRSMRIQLSAAIITLGIATAQAVARAAIIHAAQVSDRA